MNQLQSYFTYLVDFVAANPNVVLAFSALPLLLLGRLLYVNYKSERDSTVIKDNPAGDRTNVTGSSAIKGKRRIDTTTSNSSVGPSEDGLTENDKERPNTDEIQSLTDVPDIDSLSTVEIDLAIEFEEIPHSGWLENDDRVDGPSDVVELLAKGNLTSIYGISDGRAEDVFEALPVIGEFAVESGDVVIKGFGIKDKAIDPTNEGQPDHGLSTEA